MMGKCDACTRQLNATVWCLGEPLDQEVCRMVCTGDVNHLSLANR